MKIYIAVSELILGIFLMPIILICIFNGTIKYGVVPFFSGIGIAILLFIDIALLWYGLIDYKKV